MIRGLPHPHSCPLTTANTISKVTDGATAQSSEANVNSSSPKMNIRRRPIRSASFPAASKNAANTMLYAFSTHDRFEIEVPLNDRSMFGKAMFTIVASTNATVAPSAAIASTVRGSGPRLRTQSLDQVRVGLERLAGSAPAKLADAGQGLPVHESDRLDVRLDHQVGVLARSSDGVGAPDHHARHERLTQLGDPRVATGQHTPERPSEPGDSTEVGTGEVAHPAGHVERDHWSFAGPGHRRHRQVVEHPTVHEHPS